MSDNDNVVIVQEPVPAHVILASGEQGPPGPTGIASAVDNGDGTTTLTIGAS